MSANPDRQAVEGRPITITRRFAAPRPRVFEAWTSARHIAKWFCPAGFTVSSCTVDFRVGGSFDVRMVSPEGAGFRWLNTYQEIVVPERLVYTSRVMGEADKALFDANTRIELAEAVGATIVNVHSVIEKLHDPTAAAIALEMEPGWQDGLDNLAAHLAQSAEPG